MKRIDFNRSTMTWLTRQEHSYGRFNIESCCSIQNLGNKYSKVFYLGSPVIAGNVYAENNLVAQPTYFFEIVASEDEHIMLRKFLIYSPNKDSSDKNQSVFESLDIDLQETKALPLHDFNSILMEFNDKKAFSGRVKFQRSHEIKITIEFPVKHINVQPLNNNFQVETGPILYPADIPLNYFKDNAVPMFNTAFIHFNCFDSAELTLNVPTKIGFRKTSFYSKIIKVKADITLSVEDIS